ncbi:MAG: hypothetical protein E7430_07545 [Ruminococcaceae bacterium]|nr:hypothetical protein [Oscillospiraceae bacterium]
MQHQIPGKSRHERPIDAYFIGSGRIRVLINGAHHANEWITSMILRRYLLDYVNQNVQLCAVPQVNPDGVALVTGKATKEETDAARRIALQYPHIPFPFGWKSNLSGVDLNLNYPAGWEKAVEIKAASGVSSPAPRDYPGPYPLSEPETQTMVSLTDSFDPHMTISFHTQGMEIYYRYKDMEPECSRLIARQAADASGYLIADVPDVSGHAGYKDWFILSRNRPGLTVEAGIGENPLEIAQFEEVYSSCRLLIDAAIDSLCRQL